MPITSRQNIPSEFLSSYIMSLQQELTLISGTVYGAALYGGSVYGAQPLGMVKKRNPFVLPFTRGGGDF